MRSLFAILLLLSAGVLQAAAPTRSELVFQLNTAVKTRDAAEIRRCFSFAGADEATRRAVAAIILEIASWPSPYISTTERSGAGPLVQVKDGRTYTLNGNWTFQVHIHRSMPPSRGFVFPAGALSTGGWALLVTVPKP